MKVITESLACEQAFGGWGASHFFSPYPWAPNRELAPGSLVGIRYTVYSAFSTVTLMPTLSNDDDDDNKLYFVYG